EKQFNSKGIFSIPQKELSDNDQKRDLFSIVVPNFILFYGRGGSPTLFYMNPFSFKLVCSPVKLMITWSSSGICKILPASLNLVVTFSSSFEGLLLELGC